MYFALLLGACLGQLLISVPEQVYYLPRRGREPSLLLENVTGLVAAAGDPSLGVLYVCANASIVEYTVDYHSQTVTTPGQVVYTGQSPSSPTLDHWGNLYFLEPTLNTVNVLYSSASFNHTFHVLYSSTPSVNAPSVLALDDFFDFLYWGNLAPVANSSVERALADPLPGLGVSQVWAGYRGKGVDGLAIAGNWVYISSEGLVYRANKRNPKHWETLDSGNQTRVLAAVSEDVYLLDTVSKAVYTHKDHRRARKEDTEWGLWHVLHIAALPVRNWAKGLYLSAVALGLS